MPPLGIGQRVLERGLGNPHPLRGDGKPGVVHHREHRGHALVWRADQPSRCAGELHHAGRAAVDAQLVLQADGPEAVSVPKPPGRIGDELRHHEEADPLRPLGPVRQAGQDQVADIGGEVAVAPGDEDLLPGDCKGAVTIRHSPGPQGTHVRARMGFGQVHGARPLARGKAGQVKRLQLVRSMVFQCLDLTLCQKGFQLQGKTGSGHHLVNAQRERDRQAHAAEGWAGGHADPTALRNRAVAVGKAGGRDDHAVLQPGGKLVADPVQRREDVC